MRKVLEIKNLRTAFVAPRGIISAVEGVSLSVGEGECLALVGESGCGKSVTSLASMRLLDESAAVVRTDKHLLCGEEISGLSEKRMQEFRGSKAAMIFQDALSALNPVMTVGRQIDEIFLRHMKLSGKEARERSISALAAVGIPDAAARYRSYPHELSGGMRQRVLIAMAFACEPELIIADEPTTALDVTIQAQILDLLSRMRKERRTALLLISHDMSVVARIADRIAVMYSGRIVEQASAKELLSTPRHPYTRGLLSAVVKLDDDSEYFTQIRGSLPDPANKPRGCCFAPRCDHALECCKENVPKLIEVSHGHFVRCCLNGGEGLV